MVSIRTDPPSVPQNGQSLSSRRRSSLSGQIGGFPVGSSLSGPTCSGFIWWGLGEIYRRSQMGDPSISKLVKYDHLLCLLKFMNWEEAVNWGPFLKFWVKAPLKNEHFTRGCLHWKVFRKPVIRIQLSPATLGIPGGITPWWRPGPSGCGFSLKVLGKTSSSLAASLTSWTLGCSHCVVDICAEFIRVSDCFWGYERCPIQAQNAESGKHRQ